MRVQRSSQEKLLQKCRGENWWWVVVVENGGGCRGCNLLLLPTHEKNHNVGLRCYRQR
jgi:hypothetical protein